MDDRSNIRAHGVQQLYETVAPESAWRDFNAIFQRLVLECQAQGIAPKQYLPMAAWKVGQGIGGHPMRNDESQEHFDDALLQAMDMVRWGAEHAGMDTDAWYQRSMAKRRRLEAGEGK